MRIKLLFYFLFALKKLYLIGAVLVCVVALAVMVMFPNSLTEEEEALQKKYAKLKKKVGYDQVFVKGMMLIKHRTVQQYLSVVAGQVFRRKLV